MSGGLLFVVVLGLRVAVVSLIVENTLEVHRFSSFGADVGSSWTRYGTSVPYTAKWILYHCTTRAASALCLLTWLIVPVSDNHEEATLKSCLHQCWLQVWRMEKKFEKKLCCRSNTNYRCLYPWLIVSTNQHAAQWQGGGSLHLLHSDSFHSTATVASLYGRLAVEVCCSDNVFFCQQLRVMKGRTIPTKIVLIFRDLFIFYPSNHTTGELLFPFFSDKKQRLREFK